MPVATKKISACPSWLALTEDRQDFVFLPERAEVVRRIFELALGGMGSYAIANYLDQQKIAPFGRSPLWDHTTIDGMLRSRSTFGEYQPRSFAGGSKKGVPIGPPVPNYYPAVIDQETFNAAQAARRLNRSGRKGNDLANIFNGLATCAYCGSEVKFHSNGAAKDLICAKVLSEGNCSRTAWSYRDFELTVLAFLAHPALADKVQDEQRKMILDLVEQVEQLARDEDRTYATRVNIAVLLKKMITNLAVSSAGVVSSPRHSSAQVRRDIPGRFLEISLWDGPLYKCISIT